MTTETQQQPDVYHSDVSGLEKAAAEVTAAREAGTAPEAEIDTGETAPAVGPGKLEDRSPPVDLDKTVNLRDAARELGDWRAKRDEQRNQFNAAVMGEDQPPAEDFPEQYRRAKDAMTQLENELGITDDRDQRLEEAKARLDDLQSVIAEQQRAEQPPAVLPAQAAAAVEGYRQQAISDLAARYPEARDASGIHRMQYEDPERFADFVRDYNTADTSVRAARGLAIESAHKFAEEFAQAGKAEDAKFAKAHPELQKNPQAAKAIAEETVKLLNEAGIPTDEVLRSYHGMGQFPWIRAAGVQEILLKAARESLARKGLAERPRPKVPPVVQRPGVAGSIRHDATGDLEQKLNRSGNLKDAAKLLAARRSGR